MADRIALKRLTASDLTFFEPLFRKLNAGNQKAINLNADVFAEQLYPGLANLLATVGDVIPLTLAILGPGAAPSYVLSRSVTKRAGYKNWRLNGEFVRDPEDEPGRFDYLAAGDLAIMDFSGDPAPQRMTLLLVAAASAADAPLHAALSPLIPGNRRTMIQITRMEIAGAASTVPASHPIWALAADPATEGALEDVAAGGIKGAEALRKKKGATSPAALAAAKAAAEKNGRDGEALAWVHLQKLKENGDWTIIEWRSQIDAVSPFDFLVRKVDGTEVRIDAKSTSGDFDRIIHMSNAELSEAALTPRYDLWRVYTLNDAGGKLRISESIRDFAKHVLEGASLPAGVTLDSVSIDPSVLHWSEEVFIERPEEENE